MAEPLTTWRHRKHGAQDSEILSRGVSHYIRDFKKWKKETNCLSQAAGLFDEILLVKNDGSMAGGQDHYHNEAIPYMKTRSNLAPA